MVFALQCPLDYNVMRVPCRGYRAPWWPPWTVIVAALVELMKGERPDGSLGVGRWWCWWRLLLRAARRTNGARMMMCVGACATRLRDSYGGRLLARWHAGFCFFAFLLRMGLACGS